MIYRNQQNIYFTFISRSLERSIERRSDAWLQPTVRPWTPPIYCNPLYI